jgi:hypothetical protein
MFASTDFLFYRNDRNYHFTLQISYYYYEQPDENGHRGHRRSF